MTSIVSILRSLPSVGGLLLHDQAQVLIATYGRSSVTNVLRDILAEARAAITIASRPIANDELLQRVTERLKTFKRPALCRVLNLTGTVLHTNLGRSPLPEEAIEAMSIVARDAVNLEYDLSAGCRGDRDSHIEGPLCRLTGAEAATAVNNNAAAVLLVLNTLANRREVPTSRGELIEIGGSFRLPDIMMQSGCRLVEIGTTNRTHLTDYMRAIGPKTGVVLKVHTSNFSIKGFTISASHQQLAKLCRERGIPLMVDLGSGALIDFRHYGLPYEPTVRRVIENGADVVTFSGDKLLGGPQSGLIVGRADLIAKIKRNPLKRALRLDKLKIAALSALLRLYENEDALASHLPALRLLLRPRDEIHAMASKVCPIVQHWLGDTVQVSVINCLSEVGSGSAPTGHIASAGLVIHPGGERIAARFRQLPTPVIGRLHNSAFVLDLRCLEDESRFITQLQHT